MRAVTCVWGRFLLLLVLVLGLSVRSIPAFAQEGSEPKKLDISSEIFGHVGDSHEWHITKGLIIPLPVIAYSSTTGLSIFSASNFGEMHAATDADGKEVKISESYKGFHLEKGIKEKLIADDGTKVYDFSITKNVLCMLLSVILLLTIVLRVSKKYKQNGAMKAPKRLSERI